MILLTCAACLPASGNQSVLSHQVTQPIAVTDIPAQHLKSSDEQPQDLRQPAENANLVAESGLTDSLWRRVRADLRLLSYQHPKITYEMERLLRYPKALDVLLNRAEPYLHYIIGQVEQHDLPRELVLLPAVESGFRPHAYSRNGAVGLWQFMPATARMLGLQQHWWYDGRRDITASTQAAIKYLTRLNTLFKGDWLHTLAAYNAGSGTVSRAIQKAERNNQPTDYWSLDLPAETRDYVPRLIALVKIIHEPSRYDIQLPEFANQPHFAMVEDLQQIDLQIAADLADVSLETLLKLNPALKRGVTHPPSSTQLLLPVNAKMTFQKALVALPDDKRLRWRKHKIRQGETLSHIAHQYKVPISAIRQTNQLSSNLIRADRHLFIPLTQSVSLAKIQNLFKQEVRYHVRKGDSLYAIARKFQVKIADLKRWNKVSRYLHPGQKLTVYINST